MQCKITSSKGVQCSRSVYMKSSGMCSAHRSRVLRWGHAGKDIPIRRYTPCPDPSAPRAAPKGSTEEERFWARVEKTKTCWLWVGGTIRCNGVGQANFRGFNHSVMRISWLLAHGEIPKGGRVRPTCGERNCVRPDHLELLGGSIQQQPMAA